MEESTVRPALRASVLRRLLTGPAGAVARLEVVDRTGSTNTDLAAAVRADPTAWPDPSLLVADHQDAGRGREDRTWSTPPRAALTFSLAVRAAVPAAAVGWLPLLAGLGVVRAVRATVGAPATLKWPNDVLLPAPDGTELPGWGAARKVGGLLCELVPVVGPPVAVVGVGLNVSQTDAELPVPSATSLSAAGWPVADREVLAVAVVTAVVEALDEWREHGGDVRAAGLDAEVAAVCATLGSAVHVELPGGAVLDGTATGLDPTGALLVQTPDGLHRVLAGDVRHVRAS